MNSHRAMDPVERPLSFKSHLNFGVEAVLTGQEVMNVKQSFSLLSVAVYFTVLYTS